MFVKQIEIGKYRHLEDITLGPFLRPSDASELVVLAGPNGGGKSSVLELISLALSNMWSLTYTLNRTQASSSFEVTIALLPSEMQLIQSHEEFARLPEPAKEYLLKHHSYRRSFNFQAGEYAKDQSLHNRLHDLVLKVLRGSYARPLGFHLGADRTYEKVAFDKKHIFNYTTYSGFAHTWSFAFNTTSAQYRDMFEYLVTWRFHFTRRLGRYSLEKQAGRISETSEGPPKDEYGEILSKVFPGYEFIDKTEDAPTDLHVRLPSGDVVAFSDLSSGEKEVFFTLCFFQRHEVEEAVIIVDEPELHLHPSLARLLVRTMLNLKPRNQIWLATQSSEVVDEAGRDRVIFVRKNSETRRAEVVRATDEEESLRCLRDFFGQSGYIGLARAMVFTEGRNSSADRKMFERLFPQSSRDLKIIPANGCGEIERINRAVLSLLESNVGWCRFVLIRDRDYMTNDTVNAMRERAGSRLFVLDRHEIENYLIQFDVMAKVVDEIFGKNMTAENVEAEFRQCAGEMAGDVLRDMLAFRLNGIFRPEDFSVPRFGQGQTAFTVDSGWDSEPLTELRSRLRVKTDTVVADLRSRVTDHDFDALFEHCRNEVEVAMRERGWINLFPGKELIQSFCRRHGLGKPPVFQNSVIKEMAANPNSIPVALRTIIGDVENAI